jgi:hypothetical protein
MLVTICLIQTWRCLLENTSTREPTRTRRGVNANEEMASRDPFYRAMGSIAELWTKDMWMITAGSLAGEGIAQTSGLAARGPWLGTLASHGPHHGLGPHVELILRWGGKLLKLGWEEGKWFPWWTIK